MMSDNPGDVHAAAVATLNAVSDAFQTRDAATLANVSARKEGSNAPAGVSKSMI